MLDLLELDLLELDLLDETEERLIKDDDRELTTMLNTVFMKTV